MMVPLVLARQRFRRVTVAGGISALLQLIVRTECYLAHGISENGGSQDFYWVDRAQH